MNQGALFMEGCPEAPPLPQGLQRKVSFQCPLSIPCSSTIRTVSFMLTNDVPSPVPD